MVMTDLPVEPQAIADSVLAAVVAAYTAASVELPARQLVLGGGLPAWDTEQVTVNLTRVYVGMPGQEQGAPVAWQRQMFSAQLLVQIVRKARGTLANAPRRSMPAAADLATDATTFFRDARLLAGALHDWTKSRKPGTVKAGPIIAPEQQGEMLGLSAYVEVLLA